MSAPQTELVTYVSAAVGERSLFQLCDVYIVFTEGDGADTKGEEEGEGRAKEKGRRRRRRNSLVKEFKWNDEKKLEARTGGDKAGFRAGARQREKEGKILEGREVSL